MADIKVEELKTRLDNKEEFIFLDVRESYEYNRNNLGAENIPLGSLATNLSKLNEHKEEEIIVYCKSGHRSGMAKNLMEKSGFKNVRNLLGGMLEWDLKFP